MSISFFSLCFFLVAATIRALAAAQSSTNPSSSYTSDNNFCSSILNSTNFYRKQHNATALSWNTTLSTYATTYTSKCLWAHSHGPSGENLAIGYTNTTAAIEAWGNERAKYDFHPPSGFTKDTGHFTQLVWKSTTSVGCGRTKCKDDGGRELGWLLVCEYWPPGNIEGEFGAEVQKQVGVGSGSGRWRIPRRLGWLGVVAVVVVVAL